MEGNNMTKYIITEKDIIGYVDEFGDPVTFNSNGDVMRAVETRYDEVKPPIEAVRPKCKVEPDNPNRTIISTLNQPLDQIKAFMSTIKYKANNKLFPSPASNSYNLWKLYTGKEMPIDYVATLPIIYDTIEPESWEDDDNLLIIFLFITMILIKNNRNKK